MCAFFPRLGACILLALSSACASVPGAGRAVPAAVPASELGFEVAAKDFTPAAVSLDLTLDRATRAGAADTPAPAFRKTGLEPLLALGGLVDVSDFAAEREPAGYQAQLVPADTNLEAQREAELWAPDSKQMYIAAGFWRSPLFGLTKHVYYSPSRDQKYILYFKLFKGIVSRRIRRASPHYKVAYDLLNGAQDVWSYDLPAALKVARGMYYRPAGSITVGVLIAPILIGPCWVFLDNPEDQKPVLAVRARDGGTYREGDLPFEAIKVLVQRSEDEDVFGPVTASSP